MNNEFKKKLLLFDLFLAVEAKEWDESQHPRAPAGTSEGGEFVKKIGDVTLVYQGAMYQEPSIEKGGLHQIFAYNKDGEIMGRFQFGKEKITDEFIKGAVKVNEEYRRRGIGSGFYEMAEKISGKTFIPEPNQTELARLMWASKKRKFGLKK